MHFTRKLFPALPLALLIGGCNASSDLLVPVVPPPESRWTYTLKGLPDSSLPAGTVLPQLGVVDVTDSDGDPVAGADILVEFIGGPGGWQTLAIGVADSLGHFVLPGWIAGPKVGVYPLTVGPHWYHPFIRDTVALRVIPAAPATLRLLGASEFLEPNWQGGVTFEVADRFGNGVPGVPVTMTSVSGSGALQIGNGGVTDSMGVASTMVFASHQVDTTVVRATTAALPDSFAEGSVRTIIIGAAVVVSGDSQVVAPGATPALPWVIRITDINGAGISSLPVGIRQPGSSQSCPWRTDSLGYAVITPPAQSTVPGWYTSSILEWIFFDAVPEPVFHVQVVSPGPPSGSSGR